MTTKRWSRPVGLAVLAGLTCCSVSFALIWGEDHGAWSPDWPKELEPYRERASTIDPLPFGGVTIHTVPFTNRSDFEKIWPVLLSVKSKGAPLTLRSGSVELRRRWSFSGATIDDDGMIIVDPDRTIDPSGADKEYCDGWPEGTYPGVKIHASSHSIYPKNSPAYASCVASDGQPTARIELFVDGNVIDLNRIRLPADTPIIDKRGLDHEQKQPTTKPSN